MRWKSAWQNFRRFVVGTTRVSVVHVSEPPGLLAAATLYLVGEEQDLWMAVLRCPCGCGHPIHLNLLPGSEPYWQITKHDDGSVTLHPSVWRTKGCESHFFVRRGRVKWFVLRFR